MSTPDPHDPHDDVEAFRVKRTLLRCHLAVTVPLCIADLQRQGGPDDWQRDRIRGWGMDFDEHLFFHDHQTAPQAARVAEALAVLAFQPGGVTLPHLGLHFEATLSAEGTP